MSELKVASCFEFEKVLRGKSNKLFYPKSEVDAAIAELKAENQKLKRALWMARAEKNELLSNYRELDNYMYGLMVAGKRSHYEDYENHADSYNEWTTKLSNAAQVCRVKAEEYK